MNIHDSSENRRNECQNAENPRGALPKLLISQLLNAL